MNRQEQTLFDADTLHAALERVHERLRQRVAAGELQASDLHAIPADVARRATVHWKVKRTDLDK